jgi:hypothetical protein
MLILKPFMKLCIAAAEINENLAWQTQPCRAIGFRLSRQNSTLNDVVDACEVWLLLQPAIGRGSD